MVTETRTQEDLKKKYDKALLGKATAEQMVRSLDESLRKEHLQVLTKIKQAQKSIRRLDEIALKPNPLTEVGYIEMLIEPEKTSANVGWKERVKYFEEAKRQAEMLSKVKDEKESLKLMQPLSRQGMDSSSVEKGAREELAKVSLKEEELDIWYSRFKFW